MGVIHKLKENIIHFVLEQKKINPAISCRQISVLIANQFSTNVSKSSVNKILQEAALSSSVGRRVALENVQKKKFQIPSERKKEILQDLDKFKKSEISGDANLPAAEEKPAPFVPADHFQKRVNYLREERNKSKGLACQGMGFIFIKAAQWATSEKFLPAQALQRILNRSGNKSTEDLENACEALFLLNLNHELSWWSHPKDNSVVTNFKEEAEKIGQSIPLAIEYNAKRQEALGQEVSGFKLCLEDGTEIVFDPSLTSVWLENVPSELSVPLNKALVFLSKYLMGNSQSVVFKMVSSGPSEYSKEFYEMASIFEGVEGKAIKKISVLDKNNQEWVSFPYSLLLRKRRTFLLGVWPWQREFLELIKSAKWPIKTPYYHEALDAVVYFAETKMDFVTKEWKQMDGLRVVTLWQDKEADPQLMILTNQKDASAEEIVKTFMLRWPNWKEYQEKNIILFGEQGTPLKKEDMAQRSDIRARALNEIFKDYAEGLHEFCQRHFFPPSWDKVDVTTAISKIYGTVGFTQDRADCQRISLVSSPDAVPAADLAFMVKKFNESCVWNPQGQRVLLGVVDNV